MSSMPNVDWALAARLAARHSAKNPAIEAEELGAAVADMHNRADQAFDLIRAHGGRRDVSRPRVLVVDRPNWALANAQLGEAICGRIGIAPWRGLSTKVSRRVYALLVSLGFGLMGKQILGQFDPFSNGGRLILVAPNLIAAERLLPVPASDFRLWACLHEQTHSWQFQVADWLPDHLIGCVAGLIDAPGLGVTLPKRGATGALAAKLLATMTLLEGHADMVMDAAAEGQIGSLTKLRSTMDASRSATRRGLASALGVGKQGQYIEGGKFCRAVVATCGVAGMNQAFDSVENLPTPEEIAKPSSWIERVCG